MAKYHEYIEKVNVSIGNKISSLRIAKGLPRNRLAGSIGVTHQQLHKYEKGTNRISVGRLVLIAQALQQPVNFFYEGIDIDIDNKNQS